MAENVIITGPAKKDLREIEEYIRRDNFSAAEQVMEYILDRIEKLKINTAIGRTGRILRTRELIISKYPYIIPYQVKGRDIYILRVLHTSRRPRG